MSQRVTVITTKPDDLSSIPKAHTVEGQNQLAQVVFHMRQRTPQDTNSLRQIDTDRKASKRWTSGSSKPSLGGENHGIAQKCK